MNCLWLIRLILDDMIFVFPAVCLEVDSEIDSLYKCKRERCKGWKNVIKNVPSSFISLSKVSVEIVWQMKKMFWPTTIYTRTKHSKEHFCFSLLFLVRWKHPSPCTLYFLHDLLHIVPYFHNSEALNYFKVLKNT